MSDFEKGFWSIYAVGFLVTLVSSNMFMGRCRPEPGSFKNATITVAVSALWPLMIPMTAITTLAVEAPKCTERKD